MILLDGANWRIFFIEEVLQLESAVLPNAAYRAAVASFLVSNGAPLTGSSAIPTLSGSRLLSRNGDTGNNSPCRAAPAGRPNRQSALHGDKSSRQYPVHWTKYIRLAELQRRQFGLLRLSGPASAIASQDPQPGLCQITLIAPRELSS